VRRHVRGWGGRGAHGGLDPRTAWTGLGDRQRDGHRRRRGHLVRRRAATPGRVYRSQLASGGTKPRLSDTEASHAQSEWRDRVRQYLRGLEAQIVALRSLEARVAGLERTAVGRRGDKPIGVVPKTEIGGLSVIPRCAPCGSEVASFLPAFRMAARFRLGGAQSRLQDQARAPNGRCLSARHRPRHVGPGERKSSRDAP
jgi:hypothetical protein